jgi:hypothetical protein
MRWDGNLFPHFPLSPDQLWAEISFRAWQSLYQRLLYCLSIKANIFALPECLKLGNILLT